MKEIDRMASISREYDTISKRKYLPVGFIKEKQTFARIKGDVLQVFTLKKHGHKPTVTVEFGILPLCMPLSFASLPIHFSILSMGNYSLDQFFVGSPALHGGWVFNPLSKDSIQDCLYSVTQAIDNHLIPLFDKCTNCSTSLTELVKQEEKFDRNRREILLLRGEADCAKSWKERSLFDYKKYFMALKAGNYTYAQVFLNHQVNFYEKALHECIISQESKTVIEKHTMKYRSYSEQLKMLNSGDRDYFYNLIQSNEDAMWKLLKQNYPKLYDQIDKQNNSSGHGDNPPVS